jgi:hypothetical protein
MKQRHDRYKTTHQKPPSHKKRELFPIIPLIPHLIVIAITVGIYSFIVTNNYFPEWIDYIYWAVKIIIGFEVLAAAASTLWSPILGLISGLLILFTDQVYDLTQIATADGWELIVVSLIGFLVTIMVRL